MYNCDILSKYKFMYFKPLKYLRGYILNKMMGGAN